MDSVNRFDVPTVDSVFLCDGFIGTVGPRLWGVFTPVEPPPPLCPGG